MLLGQNLAELSGLILFHRILAIFFHCLNLMTIAMLHGKLPKKCNTVVYRFSFHFIIFTFNYCRISSASHQLKVFFSSARRGNPKSLSEICQSLCIPAQHHEDQGPMTNVSSHEVLVLRAAGSQSAQDLADWGKST